MKEPDEETELWLTAPTTGGNLTNETIGAFKWTYGSYAVSAVVHLGYTAVIARLLTPRDFGLVAMAQLFLRFGGYFAQMGVGQALIQKHLLTLRDIRTGFTATLALGFVMSSVFAAGAPVAAMVFDSDSVVPVARVLALSFLLQALGITAESLLRRALQFRTLAFIEVLSSTIGYMAVGVIAAWMGAGVWSLVLAGLAQATLVSVLSLRAVRHPMRPLFAWTEVRVLYSFGGRVSIIGFFEFLGTSLDSLFIGRYAGEAPLGQYNRARLLVKLPLDQLTQGTAKVLFPAFSRIQADRDRLRGAYLSGLRIIALLVIPAAAGMAAASRELTLVLLGEQWGPAAQVLPYLALLVSFTLATRIPAITCEATATLNAKLALTIGHVCLLALLLTLAIGGGLEAYALAIAVAAATRFCAYLLLMRRVVGVGMVEHLRLLGPVATVSAAVAVGIWGVTRGLADFLPLGALLALQILVGAGVLLAAVFFGPLGTARRDIHARLSKAGLVGRPGAIARALDAALRGGR